MLYTVNTKLHTAHTVRTGSPTYLRIMETDAKAIKIGNDLHKIFRDKESVVAELALLLLSGGGE